MPPAFTDREHVYGGGDMEIEKILEETCSQSEGQVYRMTAGKRSNAFKALPLNCIYDIRKYNVHQYRQ